MSSMASALFARAARPVSCTACRTVACPSVLGSATNFTSSQRGYSTSTEPTSDVQKPRWSYTPPRAKAPFSLRYNSKRAAFPVNEDPKRLDQFYIRMLGEDGDKMLSEEVKWLAVTHKSFDQGRRGFNDRLAFVGACNPLRNLSCVFHHLVLMQFLFARNIGKRIVHLQTSLALVQNPANSGGPGVEDPFGRQPFAHPALEGLENLNNSTKLLVTSKLNLSQLAQKYQLDKVLRWSPRKVSYDMF